MPESNAPQEQGEKREASKKTPEETRREEEKQAVREKYGDEGFLESKESKPTIDGLTPTQIVAYMAGQGLEEIRLEDKKTYNYYTFKHQGLNAGIAIISENYIRFNVNDPKNPIWEISSQQAFGREKFLAEDMAKILTTVKDKIEEYKKSK